MKKTKTQKSIVTLPTTKNSCFEMEKSDLRKAKGKIFLRYHDRGEMTPRLENDDVLLVDLDDKDLRKGSMFLIYWEQRAKEGKYPFVVRYLIRSWRNEDHLEMRGEAGPPWSFEVTGGNAILGRVISSYRDLGYVE